MVGHKLLPSHARSLINLFFLLIFASSSYCEDDIDYTECVKPFNCGVISNLSYPFWSNNRPIICGDEEFNLRCEEGEFPVMNISNQQYKVLSIDQSRNEMTIARMDLWDDGCPENFYNTTLDATPFNYVPGRITNISLFYNCTGQISVSDPHKFPCPVNGEEHDAFYTIDSLRGELRQGIEKCNIRVEAPFSTPRMGAELRPLMELLRQGFNVSYDYNHLRECIICNDSSGICGTNSTTHGFSCLCPGQPYPSFCPIEPGIGKGRANIKKTVIGAVVGISGILMSCGLICYYFKRTSPGFLRKNQDFEAFLINHGPLAIKRYNYAQLKKMTHLFKEKLGQGGYGTVYKGKLFDGHFVAVKMLNESKGEEEFINEIATISRTRHVNIVTLLGFCMEGQKRALVYEFMSNGSLDKFICNRSILNTDHHLGWEIMHQIATGIAQGLEYLHRGCNTRIVHFDIKPHNILLCEDFCPKISDFGLAKLCTRRESIISMLEVRGTIGYIAPEVFSRNFGQVSYKSDVYSYGMIILDIVGGREKNEMASNSCSETYFPHWLYRSVEQGNESQLHGDLSAEETEIVRKLTLIGLLCIQNNPSDRPSMNKVIEMLQGTSQTLKIPPKPFLSSPPRFTVCSSTLSLTH